MLSATARVTGTPASSVSAGLCGGCASVRRSGRIVSFVAARDHVGQEELQEARRRLDVDGDHGEVVLHRALAREIAAPAEARVVDEDIDRPAVLAAGIVDVCRGPWLGEVAGDGLDVRLVFSRELALLGRELFLAASVVF